MTIPNSLKLRGPDSPVIVVAEDSPGDIYLIRRAIQTHVGYCDLVLVDDGEKAIQMIEEGEQSFECPAMLLLDWNLPRRSGREILGRLRSSDKYRQVPVIVLTSSDSPK